MGHEELLWAPGLRLEAAWGFMYGAIATGQARSTRDLTRMQATFTWQCGKFLVAAGVDFVRCPRCRKEPCISSQTLLCSSFLGSIF